MVMVSCPVWCGCGGGNGFIHSLWCGGGVVMVSSTPCGVAVVVVMVIRLQGQVEVLGARLSSK